jgi:hypothetical protein
MKYKMLMIILLFHMQLAMGQTAVTIHFRNVIDGAPLVLNDSLYTNAAGDIYSLSMCKYYVSNISFIKTDGTAVNIEESYHLVNEAKPSSHQLDITILPAANYKALKFMVGVDSLHNVSGAQAGELDPINAMFWDWNTGYIMAKIEGNSKGAPNGEIAFHIGGFSGSTSSLQWVTVNFPNPIQLNKEKKPVINLNANISEWFKTPVTIKFSEYPVITTEGKEAVMIAENYADMFTLQSIED